MRSSLERAMKGVRRVFHVAADYRLWARNPAEIYESNVEGTRRLFEIAAREGVERIVYTSTVATMAVPSHGDALPNEETSATLDQMIGHYKRSKFLAEEEATKAAASGCSGRDRESRLRLWGLAIGSRRRRAASSSIS